MTDSMMLNGEPRALPVRLSVAELLERLEMRGRRVAVEHNGTVVPRSRHEHTIIAAGDRVEVIVAVGGG